MKLSCFYPKISAHAQLLVEDERVFAWRVYEKWHCSLQKSNLIGLRRQKRYNIEVFISVKANLFSVAL